MKRLPWNLPLEKWKPRGFSFIDYRKGMSRHTVRFIRVQGSALAIKQTGEYFARFEIANLKKLLQMGIHTLIPAGYAVFDDKPIEIKTQTGNFFEKNDRAYVVTVLEDKALPDSYLFRLNFEEKNRKRIWIAVAELLASIHHSNIYWGDASLANILIKFIKETDEKSRKRTVLKAFLADAETLETQNHLSRRLRKEELNFFFESMDWLYQDFVLGGNKRRKTIAIEDKKFILKNYNKYYRLFREIEKFESDTSLSTKKYFRLIDDLNTLKSLRKQIDEHKWYLNEKQSIEIDLKEASQKWLNDIYLPIISELEKLNLFEYFDFKTTVDLYRDIMTHKHYLSEKAKTDVGIDAAAMDYCNKYSADKSLILSMQRKFNYLKNHFEKLYGSKKII